jgi:cell wall-associated NlpC family hydrolase
MARKLLTRVPTRGREPRRADTSFVVIGRSPFGQLYISAGAGILLLMLSGGCASSGGGGRPLPFPGAASPPSGGSSGSTAPPDVPLVVTSPTLASPKGPESVVDTALAYRGVKYVYGGSTPEQGFDCSGLVQYVFAQHQIDLPRTVPDQYRVGAPVKLTDLRAGDLVFFSTTGPGPTHVGIAIDHERFVHAPNSTGVVRIEAVDTSYWHNRFLGARRLFQP